MRTSIAPILLRFFKISTLVLLSGCFSQTNNQDLISHVTDRNGISVATFEEVYMNPEKDFRIRTDKGVEALENKFLQLQIENRSVKRAVVVSNSPLVIKESFENNSSNTGFNVQPLTEIKVFWPLNIANDHIELKWKTPQGASIRGWVLYLDSSQNKLVKVLEDFVIETVRLEGAELIAEEFHNIEPSESEDEEPFEEVNTSITVLATEEIVELEVTNSQDNISPTEEVIEIEEPTSNNNPIQTERPSKDDLISTPNYNTNPETDEEAPIETTPKLIETQHHSEEEIINNNQEEPQSLVTNEEENTITKDPNEHNHTNEPTEDRVDQDISLIRPRQRPDNLVAAPPEVTDEDLLEVLGFREIPIPFSIQTARARITAVNPAHRFSGCDFAPTLGNRAGRDCYKELILADDFVEFLKIHGHQCSIKAARETFNRTPVLIQFTSNAGAVNRSNSKSLHHRGRAIDLFYATLFWSDDKNDKRKIRFHRSHTDGSSQTERENHKYYWSFVDCWRKRIRENAPKSCGAKRRGGALTYNFKPPSHNDHIHLALPLSNPEKRRHGLNCI